MLVRCINNSGVEKYLTIGKTYTVIGEKYGKLLHKIRDDTGIVYYFSKSRFEKASAGDQRSDNQTKQDAR